MYTTECEPDLFVPSYVANTIIQLYINNFLMFYVNVASYIQHNIHTYIHTYIHIYIYIYIYYIDMCNL